MPVFVNGKPLSPIRNTGMGTRFEDYVAPLGWLAKSTCNCSRVRDIMNTMTPDQVLAAKDTLIPLIQKNSIIPLPRWSVQLALLRVIKQAKEMPDGK